MLLSQIHGATLEAGHAVFKRKLSSAVKLKAPMSRVIFCGTPAGGVLRTWNDKGVFAAMVSMESQSNLIAFPTDNEAIV